MKIKNLKKSVFNTKLPKFNQFSYKKILDSESTVKTVSVFTNSDPCKLQGAVNRLKLHLEKWIKLEGATNVANRMKSTERNFLLGKEGFLFSKRYWSGPGISTMASKILLSVHRNLSTTPRPDFKTIKHKPLPDIQDKISKYDEKIQKILSMDVFTLSPYGDEFSKSNKYWTRSFKKSEHNPYTADITVDSNGRTGGHQAPLSISYKGRANGSCLDSQAGDYCAISKNLPLKEAISRVWSEWLYELDANPFPICQKQCSHIESRLEALRDKSCKTRVVAIFDSYSQIALRPFHKMLEEILTNLYYKKVDFTFSHLDGVLNLKNKFSNNILYSVDLTAATDTIPFELSKVIIKQMINPMIVSDPEQFVEDICTILVKRKFFYKGRYFNYTCGQPMGAYGSFPLLALTNHLLVQLAANIYTGRSFFFRKYAIVGDDVVIAHEGVAKQYISLLEEFGIPINYRKTINGVGTFEFCRRIVVSGSLQSVPSWNAFYESVSLGDPTPLLLLCSDYGVALPNYRTLRYLYSIKRLRATFAFYPDLVCQGKPKVKRIDDGIKTHAERVLVISEALKRGVPNKLETDNPFHIRLNYCITIYSLFDRRDFRPKVKSITLNDGRTLLPKELAHISKYEKLGLDPIVNYSRGVSIWDRAWMCKANTFYLGYIDTFLNLRRYKRKHYSMSTDSGRILKLRHICMTHWNKWNTDELRSHYISNGDT